MCREKKTRPLRVIDRKRAGSAEAKTFSMTHHADAAALFCEIIRGDFSPGQESFDTEAINELRNAAAYHGVGPLIAHVLSRQTGSSDAISQLLDSFCPQGRAEAALDLVRERELVDVLGAFADQNIHPLLIKGTPLAYTHYPSPSVRPRGDTDMLIPEKDCEPARRILEGLGYVLPNAVSGQWISSQFTAEKRDPFGVDHALDVHSRLSNQQIFAGLFSFDDLDRDSDPVAALGPNARTLNPVHALLLACTHRVGHFHTPVYLDGVPRYGGDRLIWLYDIHLLITGMSANEREKFSALAAEKRVRAVCLDGLRRASECFAAPLPDALIESLAEAGEPEPSARYLAPGGLPHLVNELRALPGWRARARLLKEHAFPPADYVLRKYDVSSPAWLPALYLHRGLRGVWKLVRRP